MNANDDSPLESFDDSVREFGERKVDDQHASPHLLITAGVHGDEYLPMLAVEALIRRFDSDTQLCASLRGRLTLIPIVNRPAFSRGHRCGDDQLDLARSCPGSEIGSPTERIAAALSKRIQQADFYVDLHTGGTELCVHPLAGYVLHADPTILQQQRKLATAFQLPLAWGTSAELQGRSLSVARDAGVPAIYVEYLGAHRELAEVAARRLDSSDTDHPLVAGCLNVMRHLSMLPEPEQLAVNQEVIEDWRPNSGHMQVCNPAPVTGFLKMVVQLGQEVNGGDLIAEIMPESGQVKHSVVSQQAGQVVVVRDYPRVNQGDSVAVIAERQETT